MVCVLKDVKIEVSYPCKFMPLLSKPCMHKKKSVVEYWKVLQCNCYKQNKTTTGDEIMDVLQNGFVNVCGSIIL